MCLLLIANVSGSFVLYVSILDLRRSSRIGALSAERIAPRVVVWYVFTGLIGGGGGGILPPWFDNELGQALNVEACINFFLAWSISALGDGRIAMSAQL